MSRVDAKTNPLTKGLTQNLFKIPFTRDKSIKFDGTDDVITTSADSTLATKTYSFWAKSSDPNVRNPIFAHGNYTLGALLFSWNPSGNRGPILWLGESDYLIWKDDECPEQRDGLWHHWLLFLDSTNVQNARLFCDGVEKPTHISSVSSPQAYTSGITLGRTEDYGSFLGSLDEFAIFNGDQSALADELYNNGQPTKIRTNPNLAHWFRMGEGKLGTKSDGESNLLFDQGPNGGLGSEKITDGGFSDTLNWLELEDAVVEDGLGKFTSAASNSFIIQGSILPTTVAPYVLQYDVVSTNGNTMQLAGGNSAFATQSIPSSLGTHTVFLTSNGTKTNLQFNNNSSFIGSIDNVSLREVQNSGTISGAAIQADGGTELVTNGDLSNGTTSWENPSGGAMTSSVVSGKLRLTSSSAYKYVFQSFTTRVGGVYSFTVDATKGTSPNYDAYLGTGQNGATLFNSGSLGFADSQGDTRTITGTFTATSTTTFLNLRSRNQDSLTDAFTEFDNVSVKEVTESVPKKTQNLPSAGSAKSMSFDGTDDFVQFALPTVFNAIGSNDFSVSLWINSDDLAQKTVYTRFFEAAYDANNFAQFNIAEAGKPRFNVFDGGTHYAVAVNSVLNTGQWYHFVGVWDASENAAKLYLDGVLQSGGNGGNLDAGWGGVQNGFLGCRGGASGFMDGAIDEVAVWNTALDGDAVKALYNAGLPTPVTTKTGAYDIYRDNLQAYYKMGDASDPAADGTSNLLFDQTNPGVGSELVTNGTFDTDLSGWTTTTATWVDGAANLPDGVQEVALSKNGITTLDSTFKISWDQTINSGTRSRVRIRNGAGNSDVDFNYHFGSGPKSVIVTSVGISLWFYSQVSDNITIDNVSVREVNGHTGTISGATIQTEAPKAIMALPPVDNKFSLNFDGTNDHLVTQVDSAAQPNNESRYYSWWLKTTGGGQRIWDHGDTTKGAFQINNGNKPLLYMASTVFQYWVDNPAQDDGNWHHWTVKIKFNDLTGCELWIDGVKQEKDAAQNSGSMESYTTGLRIGRGGDSYFNGSIDEFSIHEDLDEEAIRALFNRGRPIDVSSGHGAYDLSDKALHWWRMGDAPVGQIGSSGDVLFQGLRFEGDEMFPTNPSSSDWESLGAMTWDGTTLSYAGTGGEQAYGRYAFTLPVGQTFRLNVDVTNDGTGNFFARIGDANNALAISNVTTGSYELVHTVTESGANNMLFFIVNGGFSGSISNISLNRIRGQYIGSELVKADAYTSGSWQGSNTAEFGSNFAKFTRPSSGGSSSAATSYLGGANTSITSAALTIGATYKISVDVETDDSDVAVRVYDGSAYTIATSGNGTKVLYFVPTHATNPILRTTSSLDATKFIKFSNISIKEVGGAAVMTNMTTSDLQLDTPY